MTQLESYDDFTIAIARDAWDTFRRDALVFVLAGALLGLLATLTLGLLAGPLTVGFIDLVRRSRRGEPLSVSVLFSRFDSFVASAVAMVLIVLAVFVGTLLLVVPGLLALLFATYTLPAIAHEGLGGVEAIRRSIELVRTNFVHTLAILVVTWCVQALGSVIPILLLITTPLAIILLELAYERLAEGSVEAPGLIAEP